MLIRISIVEKINFKNDERQCTYLRNNMYVWKSCKI